MHVGVAILRLQEGLDCSEILADIDDLILNKLSKDQNSSHQAYEWSITSNSSNFSPTPESSNGNFDFILDWRQSANTFFSCSENDGHNVIGEESSFDPNERRRTVVLGVTKNKKSKKSKKLAITYRYRSQSLFSILYQFSSFTGTQTETNCPKVS